MVVRGAGVFAEKTLEHIVNKDGEKEQPTIEAKKPKDEDDGDDTDEDGQERAKWIVHISCFLFSDSGVKSRSALFVCGCDYNSGVGWTVRVPLRLKPHSAIIHCRGLPQNYDHTLCLS